MIWNLHIENRLRWVGLNNIKNLLYSPLSELRTVPTKYGGFCAKLGPCRKSRSLQKLLESTKKNVLL